MIDPAKHFHCNFVQIQTDQFCGEWQVPPDLPYFDGHFPEQAVMPAVAIIDGSCVFVQQTESGTNFYLKEVISGKFHGPITPNMPMHINLTRATATEWQIKWAHDDQVLAELRLAGFA